VPGRQSLIGLPERDLRVRSECQPSQSRLSEDRQGGVPESRSSVRSKSECRPGDSGSSEDHKECGPARHPIGSIL